ncbi:hypothetical protein C8R44DRAFT_744432 [Mycena epipterygia]|nr:hypothetical protein C8R44DRAFT_744432 [Mycena epipterygia]
MAQFSAASIEKLLGILIARGGQQYAEQPPPCRSPNASPRSCETASVRVRIAWKIENAGEVLYRRELTGLRRGAIDANDGLLIGERSKGPEMHAIQCPHLAEDAMLDPSSMVFTGGNAGNAARREAIGPFSQAAKDSVDSLKSGDVGVSWRSDEVEKLRGVVFMDRGSGCGKPVAAHHCRFSGRTAHPVLYGLRSGMSSEQCWNAMVAPRLKSGKKDDHRCPRNAPRKW